jgi:hypothetical protein
MSRCTSALPFRSVIRLTGHSLVLAVLIALTNGCEQISDRLPVAACSESTTSVVRVSTTGTDATDMQESIQALAGIMMRSKIPVVVQASGLLQLQSLGLDQQPEMVKYGKSLTALRAIDGSNIYLLAEEAPDVGLPTDDAFMEDPDAIVLLVQTKRLGVEQEVAAAMSDWIPDSTVESVGGGWYWVKPKGVTRALGDGSVSSADALEAALASVPQSSVTIGLRMTESMRESVADGLEEDGGMLTAALAGFEDSMKLLQTASVGLQFGSKPEIRAALTFENETAAQEFNESWASTTRSLTSMLGMMMVAQASEDEEGEDAPPPIDMRMFSGMAEALAMKQDKRQLSLVIDDAGWRKLLP